MIEAAHTSIDPARELELNTRPAPNFDRIARPYRALEHLTFGPALQRARTHFLPLLGHRLNALILGDGDGRFTAALLSHNPHLHADAVDLSPEMLRLLAQRAHAAHPTAPTRLRTHHTNALALAPPTNARYDLIVSHFFLDCLSDPELHHLCHRMRPHLAPGAFWLISDFRIPGNLLHLPARALVRSLYLGFRLLTGLRTTRLPNHEAALNAIGFTCTAQHLSLGGILTSELWHVPNQNPASPLAGVNFPP